MTVYSLPWQAEHREKRGGERIEARGIKVRAVDVGELAKAEGAVTCCSLVFDE